MSRPITAQIRPSLELDTIIILESLQKDKTLGKTLEQLLNSCPEFMQKKKQLQEFKSQ